jgi:hypothetical protein
VPCSAGSTTIAWVAKTAAYDLTLGQAMAAMWVGTYIHAEDIRAAIGRPSDRGPGLGASVLHIADLLTMRGWGPAVLALDGIEETAVGDGGTRLITGDPLGFVLAATGRADPAVFGLDGTANIYA